jgi:hypothetical protein
MILARTLRARCARPLLHVFLWGYVALLAGCGGSDIVTYGTGVLTMQTSNATGFLSYRVNVDAITLTRNDGVVVEPLAYPQTVDLTQMTDIGELVGSPAVPVGTYISATITLDYTTPEISVENAGNAVALQPLGTDNTAMTAIAITINFDANNPLVINAQQSSRLAINVDLASFNRIDLSNSTVVVLPYAMLAPAAVDQTALRARGLYVTQMTVTNGFIMNARPFIDQVSAIGAEIVNITPQTYWNINGTVYTGTAGLPVLNTQQVSTLIIAYGTLGDLSGDTPTFNATSVYVGTVAQDPLAEELTGVVSSRSGNTFTIRAGSFFDLYLEDIGQLPIVFFNLSTVTIGPLTVVLGDGNANGLFNTDAISVGQQVHVYGQGTIASSGTTVAMDATQGLVRIQPQTIWGTLNSATPTQASLNLLTIGGLTPAAFTFAGTGSNPLAYLVDTGTNNQSATPATTLLQAQGLVTSFGSAPPDFTATTITQGSAVPQHLEVVWGGGPPTHAFTTLSASTLVLNVADAAVTVYTGPQALYLTQSPTITFSTQPGLRLGVGEATTTDLATTVSATATPADFVTAVNATETSGNNACNTTTCTGWRFEAIGTYDKATNTFVATAINMIYN